MDGAARLQVERTLADWDVDMLTEVTNATIPSIVLTVARKSRNPFFSTGTLSAQKN